MKKTLFAIITVALLAFIALPAMAQKSADAKGGTDVGTTLCYAILSADGPNGKAPVVTYLNATSDKSSSVVQFYTVSSQAVASGANTTVTIPVVQTNGFAASDVVIIRHLATDTYERRVLDTFTTNNTMVVTSAPTTAVAAGDIIYKASTAGTIPVGNATKELIGGGIYAGQAGKPLLLEVDGTSACQVNAVACTYQ